VVDGRLVVGECVAVVGRVVVMLVGLVWLGGLPFDVIVMSAQP
jgi:hypothetical protein